MKKNNYGFLLIMGLPLCVLLLCYSCKKHSSLQQSLILAGSNRTELEKVINHYSHNPSDSLKYRAACFLIENMPYYHFYEGKLLNQYLPIIGDIAQSNENPDSVLAAYTSKYGYFSLNELNRKYDIKELDSAFLVTNIEWAFKVWTEQPWGRNVKFNDFCEYVLPYRIGDEQPSEWRQGMYEKYNHLLDNFRKTANASDVIAASKIIIAYLNKGKGLHTTHLPPLPHIGPELCDQWKTGSCREDADLTVYVLRALGIPAGVDFYPVHTLLNTGHAWTFILDSIGHSYISNNFGKIIAAETEFEFTPKIYRNTFSLNKSLQAEMYSLEKSHPPFFEYPKMMDVTALYGCAYGINNADSTCLQYEHGLNPISSINISALAWYPDAKIDKIVYLCASWSQQWIPIAFAAYDRNRTCFKHVKIDAIFRLATWKDNHLVFVTDPFIASRMEGGVSILKLNNKKESVTLFSKKCVLTEDLAEHLVQGVFEGANNKNFDHADTLYTILKAPERLFNEICIHPSSAYRYFRFKSSDSLVCDISEISVYGLYDTLTLSGKVLGTFNKDPLDPHNCQNVFDGDPYTSFHDQNGPGGWVGLDFGKAVQITKIVYSPRNRDNFIRKGDQYELFYMDRNWQSLGTKIAASDSIVYKQVPQGTLYYLRNHTRGNEEHVFAIKDGQQIWW